MQEESDTHNSPERFTSAVTSAVLRFTSHKADFYMKTRDRLRGVTGLGTGQGRHSQATHARELRRDTGRDHKPEYAGRGR